MPPAKIFLKIVSNTRSAHKQRLYPARGLEINISKNLSVKKDIEVKLAPPGRGVNAKKRKIM